IREMSTIATPPEERHPVLTFVGPYDDKQIAAAVRRELLREGQVFFVHNRVESIDRVSRRLAELVPEARIATAHGQLGENAPEEVAEIKVDLPVNAHLPHDYVTSDRLRLEAYKRLASADTDEKVSAVAEELRDRYGKLPEAVGNLIEVARFRALARRYGVSEV